MKYEIIREGLIAVIIILYVGASIVPSISGNSEIQKTLSQINEPATAPSSTTDWWPMFHHDLQHTGYSTSTAPNTNNILWNVSIGGYGIESSPAVVDGKVYIARASNPGKVYCLDALNGTCIWNYTVQGSIGSSSPAVADEKVYVGSGYRLYCLNALTGVHQWNYSGIYAQYNSPTVAYGKVYIGSDDDAKVYCLNAGSGAHIWNYTTGGHIEISSPAVWDGKIYIGSSDGKIYCLNAYNGTPIWNYPTAELIASSPTVANGRVYVTSYDDSLYCLNATNGNLLWAYTVGYGIFPSPAIAYDKVYFGDNEGVVYCIDAENGNYIWSYETGEIKAIYSSPAVADEKVYVGQLDTGKIYCLDAETGAKIWDYATSAVDGIWSSPAVANGKVYIGSEDSKVFCFGSENQPPVADFTWTPTNPDPGQTVIFDASASYDSDGYITLYEWDWNNDGIYEENYATPTTTHSWSGAGNYLITLRVTDDDDVSDIETKTVNVSGGNFSLEVEIRGGLEVNVVINNIGTTNATDVEWEITIKGGILGLINTSVNGTIDMIEPSKTKTVGSGLFLGFGNVKITATANEVKKTADGIHLFILTIIKK
jgi:outer membrane protein assembly factor BamB